MASRDNRAQIHINYDRQATKCFTCTVVGDFKNIETCQLLRVLFALSFNPIRHKIINLRLR